MKQKRLLILIGVLALLLVAAWAAGTFDRNASTVDVPEVDIDEDDIESIAVSAPGFSVRLVKGGDSWVVAEPVTGRADSVTVNRLTDALSSVRIRSIVSRNASRHAEFGVDSTGTFVEVETATGTTALAIGNPGSDFKSMYVRLGDDKTVYLSDGRVTVATDLDRWRDKTILKLPARDIASVDVSRPEGAFRVTRNGGSWQINTAGQVLTADSLAVSQWLTRLGSFSAAGMFDGMDAEAVRDSLTHSLTLQTASGTPVQVWVHRRSEDSAVLTSLGEQVFKVYNSVIDRYVPTVDELIPDSN